jgi:hypothetical protein
VIQSLGGGEGVVGRELRPAQEASNLEIAVEAMSISTDDLEIISSPPRMTVYEENVDGFPEPLDSAGGLGPKA